MNALTQQTETPRLIVRRAARWYVAGQIAISAVSLNALLTGDYKLARWMAWASAIYGPFLLVTTYKQARTAWLGNPPNDLNDVSLPAVIMFAGYGLAWLYFH
jgi:hypothetical protein